jgi:hypothetical protein
MAFCGGRSMETPCVIVPERVCQLQAKFIQHGNDGGEMGTRILDDGTRNGFFNPMMRFAAKVMAAWIGCATSLARDPACGKCSG